MTFKQTTYKGLCLAGPMAGRMIECQTPIYRVALRELITILFIPDNVRLAEPTSEFIYRHHSQEVYDTKQTNYRPAMIDPETVNFDFWIPEDWTLTEIMQELISNYKPREGKGA